MEDNRHTEGPAKNIIGIGQRILTTLVGIAETRIRLAVVELEEEKANIFQILLMLGLTLLFAAFGLMSLLVLVIWVVDPQYRLNAMIATTVVLLLGAVIGGIWTLRKARNPRCCVIPVRSLQPTARCWRTTSHEQQNRAQAAKSVPVKPDPAATAGSGRQPSRLGGCDAPAGS
jgi:uncharacterized membrane protein YqjE